MAIGQGHTVAVRPLHISHWFKTCSHELLFFEKMAAVFNPVSLLAVLLSTYCFDYTDLSQKIIQVLSSEVKHANH